MPFQGAEVIHTMGSQECFVYMLPVRCLLEMSGFPGPNCNTTASLRTNDAVPTHLFTIIEGFPFDCRKTKTKTITPTNHNRSRQRDEPITIPSNYL